MRVLAMDTTAPPGSLALWVDGTVTLERAIQDGRPFGECLPQAAFDALEAAGWTLADVDLFVVGAGPGSLTGLRVGIATAQGLAFACGKPLVGISALEALAATASRQPGGRPSVVVAWSDARRAEVFGQAFAAGERGTLESLEGPVVAPPSSLAVRWAALAGSRPLLVIGSAAMATADAWTAAAPGHVRLLDACPLAGVMAELGARAAAQGRAGPPHAVVPLYVRRPDAEMARERARSAQAGSPPPVAGHDARR